MNRNWEDIIRERLSGGKAELPASDWNDFLSRKEARERAVKRRRIRTVAISVPAAAAVLLLAFLFAFDRNPVEDNPQPDGMLAAAGIPEDSLKAVPAPLVTEPVQPEPAVQEPVKQEPLKQEPLKTEPLKTEPLEPEPRHIGDNSMRTGIDRNQIILDRKTAANYGSMAFGGMATHYSDGLSLDGQPQEPCSVTFHVEDLEPIDGGFYPTSGDNLARSLLRTYLNAAYSESRRSSISSLDSVVENGYPRLEDYRILKNSTAGDSLCSYNFNAFSKGLMDAFANHRAVVLSPDMIWLLISQAFGHYVNNNAEQLRDSIVDHDGRKMLVVLSEHDLLSEPEQVEWNYIFRDFEGQISSCTKNGIAEKLTADFSTSGPVERIATKLTLMNAVQSYFEYRVMYFVCGIPDITLQGTPADWRRVREKASGLRGYGLDWWIDELDPVLEQFVRASEGDVDIEFWQDMVKKQRPDQLRTVSCQPGDELTEFDGWFLKFFPYDMNGRTPEKIVYMHELLPEFVRTPFKYVVVDSAGHVLAEYDMDFWSGFIGVKIGDNGAVIPRIGWMVSCRER